MKHLALLALLAACSSGRPTDTSGPIQATHPTEGAAGGYADMVVAEMAESLCADRCGAQPDCWGGEAECTQDCIHLVDLSHERCLVEFRVLVECEVARTDEYTTCDEPLCYPQDQAWQRCWKYAFEEGG